MKMCLQKQAAGWPWPVRHRAGSFRLGLLAAKESFRELYFRASLLCMIKELPESSSILLYLMHMDGSASYFIRRKSICPEL